MGFVKDDDCVFEIQIIALEQTPVEQIVKWENRHLTALAEHLGEVVRTDHLLPAVFLELLQVHHSWDLVVGDFSEGAQVLRAQVFTGLL